jgi:hypothetical protein
MHWPVSVGPKGGSRGAAAADSAQADAGNQGEPAFASYDGLLGGWTVSATSTGGRQLGAKTRGDLNHPRNEKLLVATVAASAIVQGAKTGNRSGGHDDQLGNAHRRR